MIQPVSEPDAKWAMPRRVPEQRPAAADGAAVPAMAADGAVATGAGGGVGVGAGACIGAGAGGGAAGTAATEGGGGGVCIGAGSARGIEGAVDDGVGIGSPARSVPAAVVK